PERPPRPGANASASSLAVGVAGRRRTAGRAGSAGDRGPARRLDPPGGREARRAAHQPDWGGPARPARRRPVARERVRRVAAAVQPGARLPRRGRSPWRTGRCRFGQRPSNLQSLWGRAPAQLRPARRRKRVVVLDRPNPVGGLTVQGNVRAAPGPLDVQDLDFLPLPMRHGMTLGEIVRMANAVYAIHADLTVVPAAGWRRPQYYD